MQRFLIQCVNCVLLAIIFFGIPAVTGVQFGNWQISSVPQARRLMLWGLALAVAGNAVAALGLIKGRKERKLCWESSRSVLRRRSGLKRMGLITRLRAPASTS